MSLVEPTLATGDLFRFTSGPRNAKIAIVGESWGKDELATGQPFVGSSGKLLNDLLAAAGLDRDEIFCTNVVDAQPYRNNMYEFFYTTRDARASGVPCVRGLYPQPIVTKGLTKLYNQLALVNPELIIACGNYALWALTHDNFKVGNNQRRKVPTGIMSWRGSQLYANVLQHPIPLLPIVHPAAAMRQWSLTYTIKHDLGARIPLLGKGHWDAPKRNFIVRPSFEQTVRWLAQLLAFLDKWETQLAVDLETRAAHIACCGLSYNINEALCIPFMCVENDQGYWNLDEESAIINLLRRIFSHQNVRLVGQNFLYDAQYFALYWLIQVRCDFDTMIAQHACWPGTPKGLDYISSLYCHYHRYWKDEGKEWDAKVPEEQLWEYNCKDCVTTLESANELRKVITAQEVEVPFQDMMRQFNMALRMMMRGVKINLKTRADTSMDLMERIDEYECAFEALIPPDVWPRKKNTKPWYRSPKQLGEIFYDMLGMKEIKHPKTHVRTTNDAALETLKDRDPLLYPLFEMIQEYRSMGIFQNNFCNAKLSPDKRMRCSFGVASTETYRWNSGEDAFGTGTNLQNVPKGNEEE